jgi:hypothetical protein
VGGLALGVLVSVAIAAYYVLQHLGPIVRTRVIQTLSARFHTPVELDELNISLLKGVEVEGNGLRIPYGSDSRTLPGTTPHGQPRPLIKVAHFRFRSTFKGLLHEPTAIGRVEVDGMVIDLPTGAERSQMFGSPDPANPKTKPRLAFTATEIDARDTKLLLEPADPGKDPTEFDITALKLTHVNSAGSMEYDAQLINPKPKGDIHATGHFGPWNVDQPRETPLDGDYNFTHADLNTIHGLGGTLSSVGHFAGVLEKLTVDGTTDSPDFSLDVSNQPLPLKTAFHAYVDATNGDTRLDPVDGWLAHTHILARGIVQRVDHAGHDIALDVSVPSGRMEDLLTLGVKEDRPMMRSPVVLTARLHIPPGKERVAQKLELKGSLHTRNIVFTNPAVQDKIDSLSYRAQGRPEESSEVGTDKKPEVSSDLTTNFALAHGEVLFDSVHYVIPGADIRLNGAYLMNGDRFDFRGHVKTEAKPSQMVTGWKSLLLRAVDPFLARDGAGMMLGIAIHGQGKDFHFGLAPRGTSDDSARKILRDMKAQPPASGSDHDKPKKSHGLLP